MSLGLQIAPMVETIYFILLFAMSIVLIVSAYHRKSKTYTFRILFFILLACILANPLVTHEVRKVLPKKMLVVVDDSKTMNIAERNELADKVLEDIEENFKDIEPIVIRSSSSDEGTNLFSVLKNSLVTLPVNLIAGTVFITDGQVHDVPNDIDVFKAFKPFNAVIIGKRNEFDRKISIVNAPKYGLIDNKVNITIKVTDTGVKQRKNLSLRVRQDGNEITIYNIKAGEEQNYSFDLKHVGQNVFEFYAEELDGEISSVNNKAAVIVNAVRDRMKVLLVSGVPHMGERAWRNLLKSDPAIDLVHFTILRSPMAFDRTPPHEMALIAFPVDELFQKKIDDFDLIILDKYVNYHLLNKRYFNNIASFVRKGGALLFAMDSSRIEPYIFNTDLADILPIENNVPMQKVLANPYFPRMTQEGKKHPVTANIKIANTGVKWHGQIATSQNSGNVLMNGFSNNPLLITDKVGEGRVAVLTSDNIWLWSKFFDTNIVYTDLLRNLAHWLMKEPELEEGFIKTEMQGDRMKVSQRALGSKEMSLTIVKPDNSSEIVKLRDQEKGWNYYELEVDKNGLYSFFNDKGRSFVSVGSKNTKELSDIVATDLKLKHIVGDTRGKLSWYNKGDTLSVDKIKISKKSAYSVESIESASLFPPWLVLALIFIALLYVWRKESL